MTTFNGSTCHNIQHLRVNYGPKRRRARRRTSESREEFLLIVFLFSCQTGLIPRPQLIFALSRGLDESELNLPISDTETNSVERPPRERSEHPRKFLGYLRKTERGGRTKWKTFMPSSVKRIERTPRSTEHQGEQKC